MYLNITYSFIQTIKLIGHLYVFEHNIFETNKHLRCPIDLKFGMTIDIYIETYN